MPKGAVFDGLYLIAWMHYGAGDQQQSSEVSISVANSIFTWIE